MKKPFGFVVSHPGRKVRAQNGAPSMIARGGLVDSMLSELGKQGWLRGLPPLRQKQIARMGHGVDWERSDPCPSESRLRGNQCGYSLRRRGWLWRRGGRWVGGAAGDEDVAGAPGVAGCGGACERAKGIGVCAAPGRALVVVEGAYLPCQPAQYQKSNWLWAELPDAPGRLRPAHSSICGARE